MDRHPRGLGAGRLAREARAVLKFHAYAEIFPLMTGEPLNELVADIKTHGLREKIWTYEAKILDGRNRFVACQQAGIKPEFREYRGKEPLAFVVSLNVARRHLTDAQRALAAAKIATLQSGARTDLASQDARSQRQAAVELDVSRRSVQRAKKVIEKGSKALQQAVEQGDVGLLKAAAVVNLPKSEQLAAATAKPSVEDEGWGPEENEGEIFALAEKELTASIEKVMGADDKMQAAHAEIKRQAAEIAALKTARNGYMNGKSEAIRMLKKEQRLTERLRKEADQLKSELEKVRERVAIMEAA